MCADADDTTDAVKEALLAFEEKLKRLKEQDRLTADAARVFSDFAADIERRTTGQDRRSRRRSGTDRRRR